MSGTLSLEQGVTEALPDVLIEGAEKAPISPLGNFGLLTPEALYNLCDNQERKEGLVDGLLARPSLSILVGDSGLGKSPLAYQLGISVAAGIPFLGMKTQKGSVIYADFENPISGCREVLDSVALEHLKLPKAPESFALWTPDYSNSDTLPLEGICEQLKPELVIVDSLRAFDPMAEKHDRAGMVMNRLRGIATRNDAVVLLIHHIKKPQSDNPTPRLEDESTRVLEWLNAASGARAIVNQSDTRIATDLPKKYGDAALVLRWHQRLVGEGGPLFLERIANENGDPVGYRTLGGVSLLSDPAQRDALSRLPQEFTFTEAANIYGRSDNPTNQWLKKCQNLGLIEKRKGRQGYVKLFAAQNQ